MLEMNERRQRAQTVCFQHVYTQKVCFGTRCDASQYHMANAWAAALHYLRVFCLQHRITWLDCSRQLRLAVWHMSEGQSEHLLHLL